MKTRQLKSKNKRLSTIRHFKLILNSTILKILKSSQFLSIMNSNLNTIKVSSHQIQQPNRKKIHKWTKNREKQNYFYFFDPEKFVQFSKKQRLQHFKEQNSELVTYYLLQAMQNRQNKVQNDISSLKLIISQKIQAQQSNNTSLNQVNHQKLSEQKLKNYQIQLKRRHKQIVQANKKQKMRIEKLKQQQLQMKKIADQKRTKQQKEKQEQIKKQRSQIIQQKISQNIEKRTELSKQRNIREKDYNYIIKSWTKSEVLHQRMERQFRKRYQSVIEEDRKKIQSQRTKYSLNARVEDLKIKQHEEKYLKWRSQNEAVRANKMEQQDRMIQMYEQELRKYKRTKNQENTVHQDDEQTQMNQSRFSKDPIYVDLKLQQRKIAQQKRKKMETYWSSFVKEQRQPKIDPIKRQQLQKLIKSLQSARNMKKVKNQKGEYVYQQLKLSDPTLKGMQYLDFSRELGRLRKLNQGKQGKQDKDSVKGQSSVPGSKKSNRIDYLTKMRQSRSYSSNNSHKLSFLDKKDLSFGDKLQRVQRQTFKLQQQTQLSENQLKYGKFKTSEQILQHKEDIDHNHIQIVRMKLKLAGIKNM